MKRNGFDEQEADKRIASQPMTNEERASRATVVLSNEGTEQDLVAKVSCCACLPYPCSEKRRNEVELGCAGEVAGSFSFLLEFVVLGGWACIGVIVMIVTNRQRLYVQVE